MKRAIDKLKIPDAYKEALGRLLQLEVHLLELKGELPPEVESKLNLAYALIRERARIEQLSPVFRELGEELEQSLDEIEEKTE